MSATENEVSLIQIEKNGLKTTIIESDFEAGGYEANGWKAVSADWTKQRKVKPKLDSSALIETGAKPVTGAYKKKN